MRQIPFNQFALTGNELKYIEQAIHSDQIAADGLFSKRCQTLLETELNANKVLLTSSGTAALEMAAILANIKPGDEVIMPSYTFVSTANAFVSRGGRCVFVDIRPDTQNINEQLIEQAISDKTVAIVPVHYAGISCDMNIIMRLAQKYNLLVIEDAAHGLFSDYQGQALGTIGDIGCFSFHETKNYSCGEGGAIVLNNKGFVERAEIIREKGTDRSKFFRGEVDKYTWKDIGSSFLMSELQAAFLYANLEQAQKIKEKRCAIWSAYYQALKPLENKGLISLPVIPDSCEQNGHIFYLKTQSAEIRGQLLAYLKQNKVHAVFHYLPLHNTEMGKQYGEFIGNDQHTLETSRLIVRLPLYFSLQDAEVKHITKTIESFYA
ncbi:MAG TPA: dTDP-4-amino-4,6-dideoxygalactose transaminase [Methyloprofundus sp.]|uniref:dTDP-4-amino-4,6-dideoxygalactose transaminase n=1 Tax=Methyloprofundus sp. TaxID=2020875 RepID=UPI0017E77775|nr:dTDP-4-amino-4,6-dideoxygalactose transaminase [Methyloprofundus sp.]HIG64320.1 dTDP-4-amino-4,6-dideoxygalactose transaminase [Methyloprofundus sp.]HIL78740.1 dTDP-4-amino-4,6-dideoxygalactose transaminase [Methylococcales bacterium]